ncbi:RNA-directed DNA polymerase from mobile element jockey-like [Elysia marginata]|uniref:RNA-directed DNA polymerase from mobile element jockey-like n=1 Tax=Elysia marginata TaxID=1093978 RepID=A0AAV4GDU7_9GAST|nr:RNA-directed DNA polymerase from mobile element jockey-like [Elysia marginata]
MSLATIKRLNSEKNVQTRVAAVTPNQVANQLLQNGKPANKEKGHKKRLKGEMEQAMRDSSDQFENFTPDELNTAMILMKTGKAAGLDGITTEMIQHFGPKTMSWVLNLFNNCVRTCRIPNGWRKTKVVALLKPGKHPKVPKGYRPISLLCILYKLYERMIMARMSLTVEENLTPDQAGFRPGRSTCGQLLNLSQYIEDGFEEKRITGTVFVDLTAAYDTANHKILLLKPEFDRTRRFIYADDLCLATQSTSFNAIETRLTDALSSLTNYYTENSLNANSSKTQVCAFHLNNHQANTKLEIIWNDQPLKYDEHPVYLGVTLDRTLSFSQHAMNVKAKVAARNSLLRKLANSNWGADPKTLRTTALALSYSTAEYSSAVWARSCHAKKVHAELNNACRIVTGQLRPATLPLLYRTAGIAPPDIRRQTHGSTEKHKQETDLRHPLFDHSYPRARLKSRKSFRIVESVQPDQAASHRLELWNTWDNTTNEAIQPPKEQLPPGRELQRKDWVTLNRARAKVGKTASTLHK